MAITLATQTIVLAIGFYLVSARPSAQLDFVLRTAQSRLNAQLDAPAPSSPVSEFAPAARSDEMAPGHMDSIAPADSDLTTSPDSNGRRGEELSPAELPPSSTSTEYIVKRGDTLSKMWAAIGAPYSGALAAERALKKLDREALTIRPGDAIRFHLSSVDGVTNVSRMERDVRGGKILILEGSNASYTARYEQAPVTAVERTISGSVTSSISHAALNLGVPYEVIDEMVDLFSARVSFHRTVQPGDTFTLVYDELVTNDGEVVGIDNLKMASLGTQGALMAAVRHEAADGSAHYFDERGEQLGNYFLRYPVNFSRISSVFTNSRFHPVLKRSKPHRGVDFAAPTGTPVRTVGDGVVVRAGYNGGAGNMITIRHSDRYTTQYLHLSKISAGVRAGSRVTRGQVIGAVGSTGMSTGPHLHFELFDKGQYVDPLRAELPRLVVAAHQIPQATLKSALAALEREHEQVLLALKIAKAGASV